MGMQKSMTNSTATTTHRLRFSSRGLFHFLLIAALFLGWLNSQLQVDRLRRQQEQRVQYAEEELERAREELRDQLREIPPDRQRSFWQADLERFDLSGMAIASSGNTCQRASFRECKLENATLEGGSSSFQFAKFDSSKLNHAKLTGGVASFQGATFVGADLTGAELTGGVCSFQSASFENAVLIGAKLSGCFQGVNFSGARFEGADLSAIDSDDLASCYFKIAPSFDVKTKFPPSFDPTQRLWKKL